MPALLTIIQLTSTYSAIIRNKALLLAFFLGIIIISSCNKQTNKSKFPAQDYQSVLQHANQLYDASQYQQALGYLSAASGNFKNISPGQEVQKYTILYNYYYHIKHDLGKAMACVDSMQRALNTDDKRQKYIALYGRIFFYKGDILFDQNKYTQAYYAYYQGKQIGSKALDDCTISDYTYRMGMIMYKQEKYLLAASYFKMSSAGMESCTLDFKSFYRRQELLNNTGLSYAAARKPDSALYYYQNALNYIDHHSARHNDVTNMLDIARGVIYGNMAEVYFILHNFSKAASLYKKSIAINLKKGNDNHDAIYTEIKLAKLYKLQNQSDSVFTELKFLKQQLVTLPDLVAEADVQHLFADYYYQKADYKQSLSYYKVYHVLWDSINQSKFKFKHTNINEQLKRYEKDYELTDLKRHNKQQHTYLIITALCCVMAFIIMLLLFQHWWRSRKHIKVLDKLNSQINNQNVVLENALNKVRVSSQEKDRILHTVAHDLRNPVGGIASLSATMFDDIDTNEEQLSLFRAIRDAANDSLLLINELLEVTDNQSKELFRQEIDINILAANCIELLSYKAAEKNQTIKLINLEQPLLIWVSREKIWRVLSNLIVNAIKFSEVNSTIMVSIQLHDNFVQISVSDEGIGIPDDMKNNVFNMFTEAKRPGTQGEKSFGLGLSICKQIIEQHEGEIWFESTPGTGTTFFFILPLK